MDDQYITREVYQCKQCKQILLTSRGIEQHKQRCHYTPPLLKGR